jgi:hypothetical protein
MPRPQEDTEVKNFYTNNLTDADAISFSSSDSGKELIILRTDLSTIGGITNAYRLPSTMQYQVGKHQLQVQAVNVDGTNLELLNYTTWQSVPGGAVIPTCYFREYTSDLVQVETALTFDYIRFFIPHTATPGVFSSKVVVDEQGDDIGIQLLGNGAGIKLKSITGTDYILRVSDERTLIISPA